MSATVPSAQLPELFRPTVSNMYTRGLISLWIYKENNGIEKKYLLYIFPPELHTLMTSLF
jgi:hypothetical protein